MSYEPSILTSREPSPRHETVLDHRLLGEQYHDLEHQQETAALGMWVFLATEVMFFGTLFVGLGIYRHLYPEPFEVASEKLNWLIGGINTLVLLTSSLFMVLAVHAAKNGEQKRLVWFLSLTAGLGVLFLILKGFEYYSDYRENLIPGWKFDDTEWMDRDGLSIEQVAHVKLFLLFYWIMTLFHALHVTIGIVAVGVMAVLARRGHFSPHYYAPVDVTGLYWHFVDIVWIFLLPMVYLLGAHTSQDLHF